MARYCIGDVHGCLKTLREMIEQRLGVSRDDTVILLGDYIDRGPDSKGVLDYIEELIDENYKIIPLRGNHDDLLIRARFSEHYAEVLMRNGGRETLESFSRKNFRDIPIEYCDQIDSFPIVVEQPDVVCVHGSYDYTSNDPLTSYERSLWDRLQGDDTDAQGRRIICGHTPTTRYDLLARIDEGKKIILDNGCVYYNRPGLGSLAALNVDTMNVVFVPNADMPSH